MAGFGVALTSRFHYIHLSRATGRNWSGLTFRFASFSSPPIPATSQTPTLCTSALRPTARLLSILAPTARATCFKLSFVSADILVLRSTDGPPTADPQNWLHLLGNRWCLPDNGRPARPLKFFSRGGLLYCPRTTRRVASAQHCAYGRRWLGACSKFFNFSPRCAGRPGEGCKSPPDRMHPRYAQCRADRVVATRIGTFACRTFQCDTKASKRANLCHANEKQIIV